MTRNGKIVLVVSIAAAAGLFLWGRSCGIGSVTKTAGSDTTITIVKTDTIYKPQVATITNTVTVPGSTRVVHDTLETFEVRIDPADTAAILKDYWATRFYADTQNLKRGQVIIQDSVTRNRITSRRLQTTGTDTAITNTVVVRPPQRLVVSFTASVLGNAHNPLFGQGAGLQLKLPNDATFYFKIFHVHDHRLMFQVSKGWPIRFRKK